MAAYANWLSTFEFPSPFCLSHESLSQGHDSTANDSPTFSPHLHLLTPSCCPLNSPPSPTKSHKFLTAMMANDWAFSIHLECHCSHFWDFQRPRAHPLKLTVCTLNLERGFVLLTSVSGGVRRYTILPWEFCHSDRYASTARWAYLEAALGLPRL